MIPSRALTLADLPEGAGFDVIVIGAGGAGMAAALVAAKRGATVLVVESTPFVGGTTAYSAGTIWVPGTEEGLALNPDDTLDQARRYLQHVVGGTVDVERRDAFLRHGPEAIRTLQRGTHVVLRGRRSRPDHVSDAPGAVVMGRALEPTAFDGRLLGSDFDLIRPPPPEYLWTGGLMLKRHDVQQWMQAKRSWAAAKHSARLVAGLARDRLSGRTRSTQLLRGNALIGQLLLSLRDAGVTVLPRTRLAALHTRSSGRVDAVSLVHDGQTRLLRAHAGVVLATGGFNRHPVQRAARMPGIEVDCCPGAPGHTGTAHTLAENLGAHYGRGAVSPCLWVPVSLHARADGSTGAYPHYSMVRASPRMLCVNALGHRFVNEAASPHEFVLAMMEADAHTPTIPSYLITDAQGLKRYGLGYVRPGGVGLSRAISEGYVVHAPTLRELADQLEIRAAALSESVTGFNAYWADHRNTSLGPINTSPFYAVKVVPGDAAAATGLVTDQHARVLDQQGHAIKGLYAVGDDMQSIMGGTDPAPGSSLGPALVFAWMAASHACELIKR